ncbi:Predicted kinase, aminoglycoside phosphotransferase (APT) family [Actinomadura meyerae]|uniref:Predicted kinase, aminoglycoside phosphotransferase (APT) family n=1 Tax=Actinomadura meyerae TaxID=240840 RepID=A0A239NVS9_9ACTN|nr:phosphotransferase family protein [Actinomadura meyerae]SNT58548.1 Predicted kinase, aminoglycoside phosphotransferase (APT) family [Actinomadura meyerae]
MASPSAGPVPGLDLERFAAWYRARRPGDLGPGLTVRMLSGGKSNLTYAVSDGTTTRIVRRPPLGHVQATAHDMAREYTVIRALADTAVPVPETFALCEDDTVLGAPFYVMEEVRGTAYRRREQLEPLGPERTRRVALEMIGVLAELHAVVPAGVGLTGFGRPAGFLARQVRRWGRQLDGSRTRDLPDADTLLRRLQAGVATRASGRDEASIVHGDYRLDNLLVRDETVAAVIDWEMATLGDPLTDLALLLVYDRLSAISQGASDATASLAPGYPGPEEQLGHYERVRGRRLGDLELHLGLAHLKLAVILEGIHYRHLRGETVGAGFDKVGNAVEPLLAAGLAATRSLEKKTIGFQH